MPEYPGQPTVLLNIVVDPLLLRGILDACSTLGWRGVNLAYTSNYIPSRQPPIGAIIDNAPTGSTLDRIRGMGIPVVCSRDHEREDLKRLPRVVEDRHATGRMAAARFVERGFRDLAYIEYAADGGSSPLRSGFRQGAGGPNDRKVHLLSLETRDETDAPDVAYERDVVRISEWLEGLPKPLGILAYNYRMGARILAACEMAGLHVPEQVAVLCRGNWPDMCESAPVPLSAIDMNHAEHGRRLVLLLKRLVDGKPAPRKPLCVPPKGIVERRSTDILAVPDPKVAAAIRFMWDHLGQPMGVDAIAGHVDTSRRTLERAFQRCLGRGIGAELSRKRLELSKELLRGTDMTVAEITEAIGLTDKRYFHRAFKKAHGLTPKQYRNRST